MDRSTSTGGAGRQLDINILLACQLHKYTAHRQRAADLERSAHAFGRPSPPTPSGVHNPEGVSFFSTSGDVKKKLPSDSDPQRTSVAAPPQPLPAFHNTGTQLSLGRGGDRCALSGCRLW